MKIIGILNVTPDSFSDSGKYFSVKTAIQKGVDFIENGVDIIDIGGESTRPGAERITEKEEQKRILPIIKELVGNIPISVDTMNASTAKLAAMNGATIINDVSGGLADNNILKVVSEFKVKYIINHWKAHSKYMNIYSKYNIVAEDVAKDLNNRINVAQKANIEQKNIIIDPGLGFSKNINHNWELIKNYKLIKDIQYPVLISGSRKRFLSSYGTDKTPESRDMATSILSIWAQKQNAWGVRVHNVKSTIVALNMWKNLFVDK